eukprot:Opistho-2@20696
MKCAHSSNTHQTNKKTKQEKKTRKENNSHKLNKCNCTNAHYIPAPFQSQKHKKEQKGQRRSSMLLAVPEKHLSTRPPPTQLPQVNCVVKVPPPQNENVVHRRKRPSESPRVLLGGR